MKIKIRKCKDCGTTKISDFNQHPNTWDGLQPLCRVCDSARLKKHYQDHIKECRAKRKKWQEEHRVEHNEHVRNYYKRKRKKKKRNKPKK